jgi:hypothetical protein
LYDTKEEVIQINKDDTVAFIKEKDNLTKFMKICAIDLVNKKKIDEVTIETSKQFSFRVSPDFKFLIITIHEGKIIKIDIGNP